MSGYIFRYFSVCREEVERLAQESNMRLYKTSVKEDLNVDDVFQHLAENYVNKVKSFDDLEGDIGYPATNGGYGSTALRQSGMSHLGHNMLGGINTSAKQLIQIGASSGNSTGRPYHQSSQRVIGVGVPRTNGYYNRSNNNHRPNAGYTANTAYNPDGYFNSTYTTTNGFHMGQRSSGQRY